MVEPFAQHRPGEKGDEGIDDALARGGGCGAVGELDASWGERRAPGSSRRGAALVAVTRAAGGRCVRQQAAGGGGARMSALGCGPVPMARTALARRFKAARGTPPHAHVRKLRIERVTEWLGSTRLPVGEIGPATGFKYPEYLSARFRRECGVNPRGFRSQHRAKVASAREAGTEADRRGRRSGLEERSGGGGAQ